MWPQLNWVDWMIMAGLLASAALIAVLMWWACSIGYESDVNGDPERDAGYTDEEIEKMSQGWDRGSSRTAEPEAPIKEARHA